MKLVGVTGTNGKTTTATLLWRLFRELGYKAGLLSTVANFIDEEEIPSTHTTPDAMQINELLARMVNEGCSYCFMEVSSHSADQNRIAGLQFAGGIFTNITHDHLDYHKTFNNYLAAKKKFFDQLPSSAFGLVNRDDRNGLVMLQNTAALKRSFALRSVADYTARIIENNIDGMQLRIGNEEVWTRLKGEFNAYNFLGVFAAAQLLGEPANKVLEIMSALREVRGRFETLKSANDVTAIIDYAHTPDALENVLKTIQEIRGKTGVQIISVTGAGGDRDRTKRPLMGKIVGRMSDRVVLTSDNPRSEDPEKIMEEIKAGVNSSDQKKVLTIVNRKEAIRTAVMLAQPGDIILVAGKGHETYQEVAGVKHHFDDMEVVTEIFETLKK
jgi:UDP-N-acetylmuramoyl-L-alanyl-D-glutamate--2,6-diaminopimelate ligase